jgi:hypothetical protein
MALNLGCGDLWTRIILLGCGDLWTRIILPYTEYRVCPQLVLKKTLHMREYRNNLSDIQHF